MKIWEHIVSTDLPTSASNPDAETGWEIAQWHIKSGPIVDCSFFAAEYYAKFKGRPMLGEAYFNEISSFCNLTPISQHAFFDGGDRAAAIIFWKSPGKLRDDSRLSHICLTLDEEQAKGRDAYLMQMASYVRTKDGAVLPLGLLMCVISSGRLVEGKFAITPYYTSNTTLTSSNILFSAIPILAAHQAINTRGDTRAVDARIKDRVSRRAKARGCYPEAGWDHRTIVIGRNVARSKQTQYHDINDERVAKRFHLVRGAYRDSPNFMGLGVRRQFYVPPYFRGDKSMGGISKDYSVIAPQT